MRSGPSRPPGTSCIPSWAEQTGLELPSSLAEKLKPLVERTLVEQSSYPTFSDLYAERAAMILLYGDPTKSEVSEWIRTIVDSQSDDGTWNGKATRATTPEMLHVTTLSMLVLRLYLDRFEE